jgi:uncharacterized protein
LVLLIIVLVVAAVVGIRWLASPRGSYAVATSGWGHSTSRTKQVLEAELARGARELGLGPPYPELLCEADSGGTQLCTGIVGLAPGVSSIQGNVVFTRRLTGLGAGFISGTEDRDGTVRLKYRTGSRMKLALELVPARASGLDTTIVPGKGLGRVEVKARLALIIEDYGTDRVAARRFADLPGTFTAAIRPNVSGAQAAAKDAAQAGMEVLLDLPLEPKDYPTRNPGDNAILVDLSGREIRNRLARALDIVGPVRGVKTFMGGLAVEDRDVMRVVFEELRNRRLYFLDATQSPYSVVPDLAQELGVPALVLSSIAEIDEGRASSSTIAIRFQDLLRRCQAKGYAVGIIHPRAETHEVLARLLPRMAQDGIVVMGLTEVMKAHALE